MRTDLAWLYSIPDCYNLLAARSLEEINRILLDDLERAMRDFRMAAAGFRKVIEEAPSGLPAPDGSFRIERAGKAKRAAAAELRQAISRHSDFIFRQKVPNDLLKDEQATDTTAESDPGKGAGG